MWPCIVSNRFSIHYLWLSALFTQFLIIICCKKAKPEKKVQAISAGNKDESSTSDVSKEPSSQAKEIKIDRTQNSKEKIGNRQEAAPSGGYDMKNVQKYLEITQSPIQKTDLRSVKDLKFQYNPKKPFGDVRSSPEMLEEQPTQTMNHGDDRELTLLTPQPSGTPVQAKSPLQPISLYDPLCSKPQVNVEKPIEQPKA
ncbi:hypothetical protein GCK32_004577 [Trichostrongylus colubriformis]|uniref:Uncharacterized protein n=1 Tax=Trichostrongylus colubriformis TaxID=6319 RepID=A0AAN8G8W3_TRICO